MKTKEKLSLMNDHVKDGFLKIQENAKAQLDAEEKHFQEIETELDKKIQIYDKIKTGFETMGEDVTESYKKEYKELGRQIEDLQKEHAMSQEIIQYIKHNFEL